MEGRRCRTGEGKGLVRGLLLGVCKPGGGREWGVGCVCLGGGAEMVLGGCRAWFAVDVVVVVVSSFVCVCGCVLLLT